MYKENNVFNLFIGSNILNGKNIENHNNNTFKNGNMLNKNYL